MLRLCNPFAVRDQITPTAGKKYQTGRLTHQGSFTEHSQGLNSEVDEGIDGVHDDEDDEMQSHPLGDGIRQKPKLARANSAVSSIGGNSFRISVKAKTLRVVEDEIFLLTLDLKWVNRRYSEYEEQLLVASYDPQGSGKPFPSNGTTTNVTHNQAFVSNDFTYLCYDCEQTLPNNIAQLLNNNLGTSPTSSNGAFKSVLVLVIRCTVANKAFSTNSNQQLHHLLSAMASLQYFVENYQELPKGFDMTSPYNHNCLNSIEYAFMFADILMAANLKYLIHVHNSNVNTSADKALHCFYVHSGNNTGNIQVHSGGSGKEINATHTTVGSNSGNASFIRHIQDLLNSLNNIVTYASDETTRTSTLIAYSHLLIKLCQSIGYCIALFEQRHQEMLKNFHHYYDSLHEVVTLVSSCIPCIQMIKHLLGQESIYYYILSIRFWHINEQLIWLMYFFVNKISSSSPHRAMFMLWKQKLFAGIYSMLPNAQEFFFELQRMETRKQNVLGLSDDFLFDNMIQDLLAQQIKPIEETNRLLTMTKKAIVNSLLPPKSSGRKDDPGSASTEVMHFSPPVISKKGAGTIGNGNTNGGNPNKVDVMSFHARFILLGMIRMIQLHPSYNLSMSPNVANQYYSSSMTVAMKEKYFIALYEILFHLLDVTVEKKGLFKPYLLPIIAHLLMKLSIGMDRKPSTDWVFWKMAKEMSRFNDYIKRRKSIQNIIFQNPSGGMALGGAGGTIQSQASFSARSHDTHLFGGRPPTHRTNNTANLTHRSSIIELNLDTPFKDMKPSLMDSPSPMLSHRKHISISQEPLCNSGAASDAGDDFSRKGTPINVYNIGDLVDGMCTLPNGTQRWYPGRVNDIDMDSNTYTVKFDDGDVVEGKPVTELRPTKQRRKKSTSQKQSSVTACIECNSLEEKAKLSNIEANSLKTPRTENQSQHASADSDKEKNFESITVPPPSQSIEATRPSFVKQPLSTILSVGHFCASELPTQEDEELLGTREITRVTSRDLYDIHSEDEGDEDRIFEIPSVFDTNRDHDMHKRHGDVIPKMSLAGLPLSSSLPQMSALQSLSASLVCEDSISAISSPAVTLHKSVPSLKIGSSGQPSRYTMLANSNPHSHRSDAGDEGLHGCSSGRGPSLNLGPKFLELSAHGNNCISDDLPTGNTRLQSWRQSSSNHMGGDDSSRFTGRTSGRSTLKPPSSNRLHDLKNANTSRSDSNSTINHVHGTGGGKVLINGQYFNGIEEDHGGNAEDEFSEENNVIVQYLLDTFGIVTFILLKHCLLQSNELDYHCCKPNESGQDDVGGGVTSLNGGGIAGGLIVGGDTMISESTNVLFILREYLELTTSISSKYSIASYALFFEPGVYRLCKLLSPIFFDCCLKYHVNCVELADKVGEGGFGSVYRVVCPKSCNKFHVYSHCFSCYQKENCYFQFLTTPAAAVMASSNSHSSSKVSCYCWKTTRCAEKFSGSTVPGSTGLNMKPLMLSPQSYFQKTGSSNSVVSLLNTNSIATNAMATGGTGSAQVIDRSFAVKRIPRERSIHDSSVAFSLFQEIAALEKMKNYIGVCGLEDYGVTGSEYWLVLENGQCNVNEWRKDFDQFKALQRRKQQEKNDQSECVDLLDENYDDRNDDPSDFQYLEREDVMLFMIMFLDILLILRDVHTNDIAHFDIKGSNFILRDADPVPLLSSMFLIQQQQRKPSGVLFLADFGESIVNISSLKDPSSVRQRARGTMCIQSPEMLCISEQTENEMTTTMLNTLLMQQVSSSLYTEMMMGDLLKVGGSFSRNSFSFPHLTASAMNSQHNSNSSIQLQQQHANMMGSNTNKGKMFSAPSNPINANGGSGIKKKVFPLPDKTSDVWSLGCLLFELLTGNMLFADRTWPELYSKFCLDMMAGGPGSCGANAMMAMTALGDKLFGKYADINIDTTCGTEGIGNCSSNDAKMGKSNQKKFCATLLALIDAGPLVEKMSRHISLTVQKSILRILCSCMQPDPKNRIPLMDLIDMTDEAIQMLMREHVSTSPTSTMVGLAAAANAAVAVNGAVGNSSNQYTNSLGPISGTGGVMVGDNGVVGNNSSSNILDDLSFSLSISLSGWTTDKKLHNNLTNNRTLLSGTMSPVTGNGIHGMNTNDNYLTYSEEDLKVFLPYSLMTKVTDCVYVTSRTMFISILQQFLQRRHGNNSKNHRNDDNNNNEPNQAIKHLSSYLGDFIHPLDSNYKLFKPCYDLQSSIYTHMSGLGGSNTMGSNGNRENSIENISSSELFSDLINYLLHTNVIGLHSTSSIPSTNITTTGIDLNKHRKLSSSSLFGGKAVNGSTSGVTSSSGGNVSKQQHQSLTQKYSPTLLKTMKTPIVWIRIQTVKSSSSVTTTVDSTTEQDDENLSKSCGIVVVTVPIPEVPSAPSPIMVATGNGNNSNSTNNGVNATSSAVPCKIDLKVIAALVLEVSNIIQTTTGSRGAAPIVVVTVENHTVGGNEDCSVGVGPVEPLMTTIGQYPGDIIRDNAPAAENNIVSGGSKKPLVPILLTNNVHSGASNNLGGSSSLPPPLSYIRSVSVNSFGLRSSEYGETFSRLEVSFALAIAGFLSHATTKADVEPISMEDAVHLLVRMFRLMPWMEDLLDSEVLFTFLCYCFRQDLMKV